MGQFNIWMIDVMVETWSRKDSLNNVIISPSEKKGSRTGPCRPARTSSLTQRGLAESVGTCQH